MATDLDQGGPVKQGGRVYLGPSLGWADIPNNVLTVIAGGTTIVDLSYTLVMVNFNGAVTIQLPTSKPVGTNLGTLPRTPITIVDIGGFAGANPITIQPAGAETIMGLANIQIGTPFGAFQLVPLVSGTGYLQR